ncbi:hypothetical protein AQJ23_14460 [Streptomyces antibioticus]|nr:hypothetical protein [Streptomyces antibioticus]KUN26372.1 hypothetical protein AQJ23_14460 [Streptomyces antibioticus]
MEARGERSVSAGRDIGVAVTGDNNSLLLAPAVRSAYWEQVRRIAPPEILGRESELRELAEFCCPDKDEEPFYGWWRAEAWAGKTALMAWFALHPPPGVRIVPFFITARWRAQNDVAAFSDVVLEQLAELAGDSLPAHLTEATRHAHLLRFYDQAARICSERGERLVLLVDGLDEDRGVTTGPDAHSIAGVLPSRSERGVRVIVSGRLNPPLPSDVPEDHPLRDPRCVRHLLPSRHAQAVRAEAERELKVFLAESRVSRDLLGFVVAAESGLTTSELAHLSGETPYSVKDTLRARAGRTFAIRETAPVGMPGQRVHLLAHEELQRQATEMLGQAAVESYRQRLHDWFDEYREGNWPPETPSYLLRGYFQMLRARRDARRLVLCATDRARHERLLHVSGSDAGALAEIRDASALLIEQGAERLEDALRLSISRNLLEERISRVVPAIPAAWVCVGEPGRGEALARSFPDKRERALALAEVGERLAGAEAMRVLDEVVQLARQETEAVSRERILVRVVIALLRANQFERADELATSLENARISSEGAHWIVDRLVRARRHASVARIAKALGFVDELPAHLAAVLAEHGCSTAAEAVARATAGPASKKLALLRVAAVLSRRGAEVQAGRLIEDSRAAHGNVHLKDHVRLLAAAGQLDVALHYVRRATMDEWRYELIAQMVGESARSGRTGDVRSLLRLLPDGPHLSAGAAAAVRELCRVGDVDQAFRTARLITEDTSLSQALLDIALAKVREGQVGEAVKIGGILAAEDGSIDALVRIAAELSSSGSHERGREVLVAAEDLTRRSVSAPTRLRDMSAVAWALAGAGLVDEAGSLLEGAERDLATLPDRSASAEEVRLRLKVSLVRALARSGLLARAQTLADSTASARDQERIWTQIAQEMTALGRFDDAERAACVSVKLNRSRLPFVTAVALARAGQPERALGLADGRGPFRPDAWAMAEISHELRVAGRSAEAEACTEEAKKHARYAPSVQAASALARVLARSGDISGARVQLAEAEVIADTGHVTSAEVTELLHAMVTLGDFSRAEGVVERIADPSAEATAQADLVEAYTHHGQRERAERLASDIRTGGERARAHLALARTSPPRQARVHLARALHHGWWPQCLPDLLKADLSMVSIAVEAIGGRYPQPVREAETMESPS